MEPIGSKKRRLSTAENKAFLNNSHDLDSVSAPVSLDGTKHQEASHQTQQRYRTRAVLSSSPSNPSCCSLKPIRICPPTYNLHFRRMHDLFFSNGNKTDCEDKRQHSTPLISTMPSDVKIGGIRLHLIYELPNIFVINQFLSPSDVDYFFTHFISKYKFQPSYVDDSGGLNSSDSRNDGQVPRKSIKNPYRTSTFISLNKQHNARIARLEEKVASLFGCSTKQIEGLQIVRYQSPSQCFQVHHDLGVFNETTGQVELPNKSIWYQRRIITLFIYLNTVPPSFGGATHFPRCTSRNVQNLAVGDCQSCPEKEKLEEDSSRSIEQFVSDGSVVCRDDGLRIYPVAGRAVVFSNVLASGLPDPRTIHAGEPVFLPPNESAGYPDSKKVTKYGLNIWICES